MVVRFLIPWIAVITCLSMPAFGRDQDPSEIQARKDCLTGKPEDGVALLADLFAKTGNANFLYNQARCYQQNARPEDAINRFREYLRVAKDVTPAEKADVDKQIEDCRAVQAEQEREKEKKAAAGAASPVQPPATTTAQPEAAAPSLPVATVENPVPQVTPGALDLTTEPATSETQPDPIYKTWWFWTGAAAVVVAGTVTAIILSTRSSGACDGVSLACMGVK